MSQHRDTLCFGAVLGVGLLLACTTPRPSPQVAGTCPEAPADARPFRLADSLALVGRYDLLMVTTNWPSRRVTRAEVELWPNPSSRRSALQRVGRYAGARPIAGVVRYSDGKAYDGASDEHTTAENPATELLDSTLYLGTPDAMDAIYTSLRLERISSLGFWGRFGTSSGFEVTIDSMGQRLPDAAGVFCAIRRSET